MNKEQITVSAEVKTYLSDLYSQIEYELREDYKDGLEKALEEISQLTNNWNELEEWLKDFKRLYEDNEFQNNAKFCITVDQVLDKMEEIKENK